MAFSKAHLYPADLQIASKKMKAMAYPARLQILFFLLQHGPTCVQDIAIHHPLSKEALSGHLAILRDHQLVSCMERYPYTFYQPDRTNFRKAIAQIRECLDRLEQML
jgi:DNA-binding transcriptional ArsR family regulator